MTNRHLARSVPSTLLAFALLVTVPANADRFQTFTGSTVGGPSFLRPNGAGPELSATAVPYQAQRFVLLGDTRCVINSSQEYDGYLHLYDGGFDPGQPLDNLLDGDDDGELSLGSSRIPSDLGQSSIELRAGTYWLVTSGFTGNSAGTFQNLIQCDGAVQPLHDTCFFSGYPREQQVCLQGRFAVAIDEVSNHPSDGRATPVRFGSSDSAFFWFFNPKNFEVLIKVLDGCSINNKWWVFFAATTNQAHRIRVGDLSGGNRTYDRTLGPPAAAETDTQAFDCP